MTQPTAQFDGLLVVDKPGGITSRDAVDRAQRWFPRGVRLGHTGTLDPLATGVLVLCAGVATRLTEYVQQMGKTYRTTIHLGARSDTDDADGTVTPVEGAPVPTREQIESCLPGFLGEIDQVPPAYSAAKLAGKRAHALARSGEEVNLAPRRVRIDAIEVLHFQYPLLGLEIHCGKGTYIRSLARDLGARLGCGGYVETLRRTRVGPFRADEGLSLDTDAATARSRLLAPALAVAELPRIELNDRQEILVRQGQVIPLRECVGRIPVQESECALFSRHGNLVAIARLDPDAHCLRPAKVFPGPTHAEGSRP